jgi:hypothetical protein
VRIGNVENVTVGEVAEAVAVKVKDDAIGLGNVLALCISWSIHKSILWALFHGVLGWFYIIWYVLTR